MDKKHPIVAEFDESGLTYGDFISHKDLDRWANLSYPRIEEVTTQAELQEAAQKYALSRLSAIEKLKLYCRDERQMYLQPIHGQGYRILHPREQTDAAIKAGMRTVRKGLQHAEKGILQINKGMLTTDERAYNSSVASRLQGLKLMMGRKRDLLANK